jgi:Zn-finger nucleic acid-binding protein
VNWEGVNIASLTRFLFAKIIDFMYDYCMECPNDKEYLEKVLFHNVGVDYCPRCIGMWFDYDELRLAKDDKDKNLNWVDVDLWRDRGNFRVSRITKFCPVCRIGLVEIRYDESKVKVDYCKMCKGVWLDRGEFKQIINYLKNKSDYELLNNYTKNFVVQLWEVFSGPEGFRSELEDFLTLIKLFNYKFISQHPYIDELIESLPK